MNGTASGIILDLVFPLWIDTGYLALLTLGSSFMLWKDSKHGLVPHGWLLGRESNVFAQRLQTGNPQILAHGHSLIGLH